MSYPPFSLSHNPRKYLNPYPILPSKTQKEVFTNGRRRNTSRGNLRNEKRNGKAKERANYRRKISSMRENYAAAESEAKREYGELPFKSIRKRHYRSAWNTMPKNYKAKVKKGLEDEWAKEWSEAMFA